jgi:hypothetical protein
MTGLEGTAVPADTTFPEGQPMISELVMFDLPRGIGRAA